MLAQAAVSIGLKVNRLPSLEPLRLDDWFLGAGHGSQQQFAPVPFFPEGHQELTKSWMDPFMARSHRSQQCRSRPRRSSTSCMMHHKPPLPHGPGLSLLIAMGALLHPLEPLRPTLNQHLGRASSFLQECFQPLDGPCSSTGP